MQTPLKKLLGKKHDNGKIQWQLLPWNEAEQVAQVMTDGAAKYSPDNWKHVPDAENRYFAALMRHAVAWKKAHDKGCVAEKRDPESGRWHLAHLICCALFLMFFDNKAVKK